MTECCSVVIKKRSEERGAFGSNREESLIIRQLSSLSSSSDRDLTSQMNRHGTIIFPEKNAILILCGLPGAGKTTLAQKIRSLSFTPYKNEMEKFFQQKVNVVHICYDEIYDNLLMEKNAQQPKHSQQFEFDAILWHQSRKRAFQCAIDALTTNHNHVLKV
jgi:hypothetical protein